MAPLAATLKNISEKGDLDELSPSEDAYYQFRQAIEAGIFDAGFDLLPAKSSANTSRQTGKPFVDQTLRNHLMNGAAFGSRINYALSKLGDGAALSKRELKIALALYAVHDAHKTEQAQKRREEKFPSRNDADKDISDAELRDLITTLRLDSFVGVEGEDDAADIQIGFNEYLAAALATEKSSGRHNSVYSREFAHKYRAWVRLMDAAAGWSSPTEYSSLERRINEISEEVSLHSHYLRDTKGITTNILTKMLADRARDAGAIPVVYFGDGALYLTQGNDLDGIALLFPDESDVPESFYGDYLAEVVNSNPQLGSVNGIQNSLNETNWGRGYLGASETTFLFAKSLVNKSPEYDSTLEAISEAVRGDILSRAERSPKRYSIFEKAAKHAVSVGALTEMPSSYEKPQFVGAYIGTLFRNFLYGERRLCQKNYTQAIQDVADALDVPDAVARYEKEPRAAADIDSIAVSNLASLLSYDEESLREELASGISWGKQLRIESVYLALEYLFRDGEYDNRSLNAILEDIESGFLALYDEWPEHWSDSLDEDGEELSSRGKQRAFTNTRTGNLSEALPRYVSRYLEVDGEQFSRELDDPTFDEYLSPKYGSKQARMCLLCREELLGDSTSFDDYETNEAEVGRSLTFTHLRGLDPEGGDPTSVVCPMCQFELNLRNAAHSTQTDVSSAYLFVAPDYFHSPVDLAIADRLNELLTSSAGSFINFARRHMISNVSVRSEAAEQFLEVFDNDGSEDFQRSIQNYDSKFTNANMIGVFRVDTPTRPGGKKRVKRTACWTLAHYIAHLFA
jgi:hypothetical protein